MPITDTPRAGEQSAKLKPLFGRHLPRKEYDNYLP